MSSIDKLLIRGIRAFSPYNDNVIEFYTPLTIIVGHNGAGKTTIIECLKYATTGDLPPNSKGGAFVHDPKVSHEVEVKGQIKLKFKNTRGQTMVCTRSMQSSQKRTKIEQKTLESVLSTTDPATGQQVSISSRCAEMDSEIPLQLGVSRAVLDNVLFCHQEDSFWPLAEASVLKKKFDDIFAATKYTKALAAIKAIRKELALELKLEGQKLDFMRTDMEKANRIAGEMEKCSGRIGETQRAIAGLDGQIREASQAVEGTTRELEVLTALQAHLERSMHDLELAAARRADLSEGLPAMDEYATVEALEELLRAHMERDTADGERIDELRQARQRATEDLQRHTDELSKSLTDEGIIRADAARLATLHGSLSTLCMSLCEQLGIPSPLPESLTGASDEALATALAKVKESISQRRTSLAGMEEQHESAISRASERTSRLAMRIDALGERIGEKSSQIEANRSRTSAARRECDSLHIGREEDRNELQQRLMEEEAALDQARLLLSAASHEERLAVAESRREHLEGALVQTHAQLAACVRLSDVRMRLSLKLDEASAKEKDCDALWASIDGPLGEAARAASSPPVERGAGGGHILEEAERLLRRKERLLRALQERLDGVNSMHGANKSQLSSGQGLLEKKEALLEDRRTVLRAACGDEDFDLYLSQVEEQLRAVNEKIATTASSLAMYEAFSGHSVREKACPLCERPFSGEDASEDGTRMNGVRFVQKMQRHLYSLPGEAAELKSEAERLGRIVDNLKKLRSASDDVDRLQMAEIPELTVELERLSGEVERNVASIGDLGEELARCRQDVSALSAVVRDAGRLAALLREASQLRTDIGHLQHELAGEGAQEDMAQVQAAQCRLQEDLEKLCKEIGKIRKEAHQLQSGVVEQETRFRDAKEASLRMQIAFGERDRLCREIGGLEEALFLLEGDVTSLVGERQLLFDEEQTAREALAAERKASEQSLADARAELAHISELEHQLDAASRECGRLKHLCSPSCLAAAEERSGQVRRSMTRAKEAVDEAAKQLALHGQGSSEAQLEERRIRDTIQVRRLTVEIERLEGAVEEDRRSIAAAERSAASRRGSKPDGAALRKQLHDDEMALSALMGERSGALGEVRQLQDQSSRLAADLAADYGTIEGDYRDQFVRCNATLAAIDDLEKYAKALDQGIMKYHSFKMAEINRIIREIWMSTYQGADIDSIEIRTDDEGGASGAASAATTASGSLVSAGGASSGRSYNYRLVMIKGDCELDMRGRSSAGQRVLASLIIRLALAETFGQHCGLLALDEPTTNLDRDNIDSLAASLAAIIKSRSRFGANFQLILITHDEDFVNSLGRHQCADYYWRIAKDDAQFSTIERQSFSDIEAIQ